MLLIVCGAVFSILGCLTPTEAAPLDFVFDCQGIPDNTKFWWACGAYGVCRQGQYTQVDCVNGTSYDRALGDCRSDGDGVSFPCNTKPSCQDSHGPGHRFPEMSSDQVEGLPACSFYYTCSYGRYLGHQKCNLGTVYDELRQICSTPSRVPPPCGSFLGGDEPNSGFVVENGRAVISAPTDNQGNIDRRGWPFTNDNAAPQGGNPGRRRQRFQQQSANQGFGFANAANARRP